MLRTIVQHCMLQVTFLDFGFSRSREECGAAFDALCRKETAKLREVFGRAAE